MPPTAHPGNDVTPGWFREDRQSPSFGALGDSNDATYARSEKLRATRPNVILLCEDDMPWYWMDPYHVVNRPVVVDRLLSKGLWLPNYMTTFSTCAPSRGTLYLAGQYDWISGMGGANDVTTYDWASTWWRWAWGQAGKRLYQTAHWGKLINNWGTDNNAAADVPGPHGANVPQVHPGITDPGNAAGSGPNSANWQPFPVGTFDEFYPFTYGFSNKKDYTQWRECFDADGFSVGGVNGVPQYGEQFIANSTGLTNPDHYESDKCLTDMAGFMERAATRPLTDPRHGRPYLMTIATNFGHTPAELPPTSAGWHPERAAKMAFYDDWIDPIYDRRTEPLGTSPRTQLGVTGTTTSISTTTYNGMSNCPYITISGLGGMTNQYRNWTFRRGGDFGIVLFSDDTHLILGEWYDAASMDAQSQFSLSASTPSGGSFILEPAKPNIDWDDSHLHGAGGPPNGIYGGSPGQNVQEQRNIGRQLVALDEILEGLCAKAEELGDDDWRYGLENTIIIMTGDNGYFRGEFGEWQEKNQAPPDPFRVPFAIRWDGHIPAGEERDWHVAHHDIMPTLLAWMGIDRGIEPDRIFSGKDLSACFTDDEPFPYDRAFLQTFHPTTSAEGIVSRNWRLFKDIAPPANIPGNMLHEWTRDPYALRNRFSENPSGHATALQAKVDAYYDDDTEPPVQADLAYP